MVVEFLYDGIGRRLSKVITDDTGDDTLITTWKYHYLGGQITTIEVDAVEVDDSEPPEETAVRDETLHIHLGAGGQPLSFEWVRYDYSTLSCPPSQGGIQGGFREPSDGNKTTSVNGQSYTATTLSDTYYYHYDIHGNVIKVTDSSATTKISYEYDVLGEISSVTNPDGITNPFTFRGGTQAMYDEELELYFGGGYYRADLGTTISSSGIASNPTSENEILGMAKNSSPEGQLILQSNLAINSRRSPSITSNTNIATSTLSSTSSSNSASSSGSYTYFWVGSNLYRRNSSGVASMVSAGSDVYQQKQEERMREPDWNYVSWVDELGVHRYGSFEEYHQWFMNQRLELEVPEEPMLMRGTPASHYYNRKGTMYDPWSDFDENGRLKGVDISDRSDPRGIGIRARLKKELFDSLAAISLLPTPLPNPEADIYYNLSRFAIMYAIALLVTNDDIKMLWDLAQGAGQTYMLMGYGRNNEFDTKADWARAVLQGLGDFFLCPDMDPTRHKDRNGNIIEPTPVEEFIAIVDYCRDVYSPLINALFNRMLQEDRPIKGLVYLEEEEDED